MQVAIGRRSANVECPAPATGIGAGKTFPKTNVFGTTTEERLVEAKDRAWLGEVAALEEGIKHLRMKKSEA